MKAYRGRRCIAPFILHKMLPLNTNPVIRTQCITNTNSILLCKVVPYLCHEGIQGRRCIDPLIPNFGTRYYFPCYVYSILIFLCTDSDRLFFTSERVINFI